MATGPMVILNFKVTLEEQKLIEKHAKKAKMNLSDYVRACVYQDMIEAGDLKAMRVLGKRAWDKVAAKLKALGWVRLEE